ncbi:hypothetical protein F1D05_19540 [Kribbella qitaiheensis]|uniref:Uncharacterized protein n=1 Tax=Kribbella qitaiheensis TaxID=1544730 RepID=A0A7G6X0E9_9ACTN|nr:hypothetical protein [Kribbella qitaiheensis]QNE19714.1 hypothetical protein F1D05_19540 [Kribbella qitaiheensis]
MKFNLTRTAGLAAAVALLAGGGLATAAVASTSGQANATVANTQAAVPALKPAQLSFVEKSWGDPKTDVGVITLTPKGWAMVKLSTFEAKFTSPNKLWNLRIHGNAASTPMKQAVAAKLKELHAVKGFQLISQTNSSVKSTSPYMEGETYTYATIVYSYPDGQRGTRLVVERIISTYANTQEFELAAGGRPQDRPGLEATANAATRDYVRLP